MELKEEFLRIVQEVWAKLQGLPQAGPLELGAFFIIVLFIGEVCLSYRCKKINKKSILEVL